MAAGGGAAANGRQTHAGENNALRVHGGAGGGGPDEEGQEASEKGSRSRIFALGFARLTQRLHRLFEKALNILLVCSDNGVGAAEERERFLDGVERDLLSFLFRGHR